VSEVVIAALMPDQGLFGNNAAYGDLAFVNQMLNIPQGAYQSLNILLSDIRDMDAVANRLHTSLSIVAETAPRTGEVQDSDGMDGGAGRMMRSTLAMGAMMGMGSGAMGGLLETETPDWEGTRYTVTTLDDLMGQITAVVSTLNTIALVIFIILLTITMVGILNTFRMILLERTREIGTIRALGMQRGAVRNTFLLEALYIALGGAMAGIVLALILAGLLSLIGFSQSSPMAIFMLSGHLSFIVRPLQVFGNVAILVLFSMAAAYLPARKAARIEPANALRTHY
jgi:putative ABC transport system permease protein